MVKLSSHNHMKGYLAGKSELNQTDKATYIMFTIAEPRRYKNKDTSEYENNTQYFPFIAFSKTAEYINQYVEKNHHMIVEYRLDVQKVKKEDDDYAQSVIRLTAQSVETLESSDSAKARQKRFEEKNQQKQVNEPAVSYEINDYVDDFVTKEKNREMDDDDFAF
ncbi:MAG TPA: single-stranded DNA-binding protein [Candidatus Dormibacteraeota bacterium]|nr:single-stranded DNA-binding protein [Candidatus Dormibacteraeota bacterium]